MNPVREPVCALILAGRRQADPPDRAAVASRDAIKAFTMINGRSMLERVVCTLRGCPAIGDIHLSVPADLDLAAGGRGLADALSQARVARTESTSSPSESVRRFAAPRLERQTVLVTTADHPLLATDMVETFLDRFTSSGAEAAAALTSADRIAALYPGARRTRLNFADGGMTGCNLFAFRGLCALRAIALWRGVERDRKRPWRIAGAVGWTTLGLHLAGRLTIDGVFARLSRRCDCNIRAILMHDLHAGIDVDKVEDLELVTEIITRREGDAGRTV